MMKIHDDNFCKLITFDNIGTSQKTMYNRVNRTILIQWIASLVVWLELTLILLNFYAQNPENTPNSVHIWHSAWLPEQKEFEKYKWQFCILLFIPVILVCHKPWFENVLLWPTFWPLPIFDLGGQKVKLWIGSS